MMNKKGSLQDLLFVGIIVTFFSMVLLFGFYFTSQVNDHFQAQSDDLVTAEAKVASASLTSNFTGVMDNSFLFLALGLSIVALILASLVRVHPIFVIFFIIGWIALIFVSGLMSNIYQEFAANPTLAPYAEQLIFTSNILEWLPLIVGVLGTLMMVILYKTDDTTF